MRAAGHAGGTVRVTMKQAFYRENHHALRLQDLAAVHDLGRHARRLEGGRRHRAVRVGLDVRPLRADLQRPQRPVPRGLAHPHRAGAGDEPPPRRGARDRRAVPPPGGPRQHGRDARPDLPRPPRARAGRRVEHRRGQRLRDRPARHQGPHGPLRRGVRRHRRPADAGALDLRRHLLRPRPRRTASPRPSSSRTRRSASAGAARSAPCAPSPASPSTGTTSADRWRSTCG